MRDKLEEIAMVLCGILINVWLITMLILIILLTGIVAYKCISYAL